MVMMMVSICRGKACQDWNREIEIPGGAVAASLPSRNSSIAALKQPRRLLLNEKPGEQAIKSDAAS